MSLIKWYHPVSKQNYQSPVLLTPSLLWEKPEPLSLKESRKLQPPPPPIKGVSNMMLFEIVYTAI